MQPYEHPLVQDLLSQLDHDEEGRGCFSESALAETKRGLDAIHSDDELVLAALGLVDLSTFLAGLARHEAASLTVLGLVASLAPRLERAADASCPEPADPGPAFGRFTSGRGRLPVRPKAGRATRAPVPAGPLARARLAKPST